VYGILSQLAKKMGRPAMKRVLNIIKQYPEARPIRNLKAKGLPYYGPTEESRLGIAEHLAKGSDRWLNPYPGTFMNYVRGKVDNDPQRFRKISDFFRANPEKRKTMDDWYQEMGSEGWWGRSFLDDMIDEAETTPMSLEDLAAAELSRVGKKPYTTSGINRYLTKEYKDLLGE
jgi:hypothetical protein